MIANYVYEKECFLNLIDNNSTEKIMLLHGSSGMGKTTLLRHCVDMMPESCATVLVQLRQHTVDVSEIFFRTVNAIGKSNLPNFFDQIAQFQRKPTVNVANNIMFSSNDISVALDGSNCGDHELRLASLTDSLFYDVDNWGGQILFVFDSYEDAQEKTQHWISGPFLARASRSKNLQVLIAGQKVPNDTNIEWGSRCGGTYKLSGVNDAQQWMSVVEALGKEIPYDSPHIFMAGICEAHNGNPAKIATAISSFPMCSKT